MADGGFVHIILFTEDHASCLSIGTSTSEALLDQRLCYPNMYNLPEISESVDQLRTLAKKERNAQIQRRFHMLFLLASGEARSRSEAARQLKVHRTTVADWLALYEEGGLEELRRIGTPGPEPGQQSIPPKAMQALRARLEDGEEGFGSYGEIQQWLACEHDVDLTYSTVHGIVRYQIGAKPKAPRPSHPKKKSSTK